MLAPGRADSLARRSAGRGQAPDGSKAIFPIFALRRFLSSSSLVPDLMAYRYHCSRARIVFPVLMVLLVCGTLGAQPRTKKSRARSTPVTGGRVALHAVSGPESLNLITAGDALSQEVHGMMYEMLVTTDPFTLEPVPWIAESLPVVSSDHLVYEYRLRRDARFSDGHPITADDFIFYLKSVKNPRIPNAAPLRGYYSRVERLERIDGDPYRLRAVMNEPYHLAADFIGGMMAFPKHIWDPQGISDAITFNQLNGDDSRNPAIERMAEIINDPAKSFAKPYLVASGPYIFGHFRENNELLLLRNRNYWNRDHKLGKAYPDSIVYAVSGSEVSGLEVMKSGMADFTNTVKSTDIVGQEAMLERLGLAVDSYDYPAYIYIGYNQRNPLFQDRLVRTALAHTIDRPALIRQLYAGLARPVQSPIHYKRPEYDSTLPEIPFDLKKASQLLAQAGWSDSDRDGVLDKVIDGERNDFRFQILVNEGNASRRAIAAMMAAHLKMLGIEADIEVLEWARFLQRTRDGRYDALIGGWATSATEGDLFQIWHSESAGRGGSNYINYGNPELDSVIEAIRTEHDFEKRKPLYRQAQRIIHQDQPYTFLFSPQSVALYRNHLHVGFYAIRPGYNPGMWWVGK